MRARSLIVTVFTAAAALLVALPAVAQPTPGTQRAATPIAAAAQAIAPQASAAGSVAAASRMAAFDAQLITLVNNARRAVGAPAVQEARGLTSLSVWWSNRMATGGTGYVLKHNPDAWTMLPRYGAASRTAWGENVAKFTRTISAATIFNAYMHSPGHKANILNAEYRYVGMGTMTGATWAFNTMTFTDRVDPGQVIQPTRPVRGTLSVRTTSGTPVAGVRYSVRRGSCAASAQVVQKSTASSGNFAMDLRPGAYCAIPTAWPHTVNKPPRRDWRVFAGVGYKVTAIVTRR